MGNGISLAPGFSPVVQRKKGRNRFNGFVRAGKPLKRLAIRNVHDTRLQPGANESQTTLLIIARFNSGKPERL